jgi:hypothetical protein
MSKTRLVINAIGIVLLLGAIVTISEAQGTSGRDFISTNGVDAGTCAAAAPCRTISFALTQLANNGELVFLNSGGYGPATITQGVTLSAEGIHASISAPASSGLTINAPGNVVVVRGLTILGGGSMTSNHGIAVTTVGTLYLQGITVQGFHNDGVNVQAGTLFMQDSDVRNCGDSGLRVQNSGTTAFVRNSNFSLNAFAGAEADEGTTVTVANSTANHNGTGFYSNGGGLSSISVLALSNDYAVANTTGMATTGSNSLILFDHVLVTQNGTGASITPDTTMTGTSPGTSLIVGNTTTDVSGMIGTATVLQ